MEAIFIILTGSLVAINCGLLGCFLVLRRMTMIGDAISHAVLPGIVTAFLITGSRDSLGMLVAAIITGVVTTFLIQFLQQQGKLQSDASIGISFTWLFALGIILLSSYAGQVDLDQECVLYGEIAYVPIDLWILPSGLIMGPRPIFILLVVLGLVVFFIVFFYKELFITTFDPEYATSTGFKSLVWHYLLMGLVSIATVASFESVGAILVVAFIVAAPATAYMLTDNLPKMLYLTVGIGIITAIGGYYLAMLLNSSIAGAMTIVAGCIFTTAFFFSPKSSFVVKNRQSRLFLKNK
ncbi:MAG: metal ABC transporter permease [Cyclobacteriaceae bacterium]